MPAEPARGLTVADVAVRYRVSPDKVRRWIDRGELAAVNTADDPCGRPQLRITPEAVAEFERRRAGGKPARPTRRRRRPEAVVDFYPD
jgi:excisionase family DNA binding protein